MIGDAASTSSACVRQADWRFLLPRPSGSAFEHLVLLGGSTELRTSLLELGVARRVSGRVAPDDRADAVIILAGAIESPAAAVAQLDRNGVFYWEIDRRTPSHVARRPTRALREIRQLGLTPTGTYWVKPGFPMRQMYLPLGAREPFRWYLDTLYQSPTPARRLLKGVLRLLATHRRGLSAFAPCYAVTAVRGDARPPALIEYADVDGVGDGTLVQPLLLASAQLEWSRVVLMLFKADAGAPVAAIKLPRIPAFNPQIEWESSVLRELRSRLPTAIRTSIPSSAMFQLNDLRAATETCVSGSSFSSRAGSTGAPEDLGLAARWLASFHRETTIARVPAADWLRERLAARMFSEYAATYGATDREAHLFDLVNQRLESLDGVVLPIVWQHNDFGPWNVYRDQGHLSVIDWEMARRGPALIDLLYFAAHWSAAASGNRGDAEYLTHFEGLFCSPTHPTPLNRCVHQEVDSYMRQVGVPRSLLSVLLVYTFLEQALDRAQRLMAVNPTDATSRACNRFVGYVEILAKHADRLFGEARA